MFVFVFVKKQREMGFECVIVGLLLCLFNVLVVALEDAIAKQAMANFNKFSPVIQCFLFFSLTLYLLLFYSFLVFQQRLAFVRVAYPLSTNVPLLPICQLSNLDSKMNF